MPGRCSRPWPRTTPLKGGRKNIQGEDKSVPDTAKMTLGLCSAESASTPAEKKCDMTVSASNKLGLSTHRVRNGVLEDGLDPCGVSTILSHPIPDTVGGRTQLVLALTMSHFFFCRCRRTFCRAQSKKKSFVGYRRP